MAGLGPGEAPKRVMLLPEVEPRTVAVLSNTGTLYRCVLISFSTELFVWGGLGWLVG